MTWQEALSTFAQTLLTILMPVVGTVVAGFLVALLNKYLAKAKIDLDLAQQERIKQAVEEAIRATEEVSRRQLMSSGQKRALTSLTVGNVLPDVKQSEIDRKIDAQLPVVRKETSPVVIPAPIIVTAKP